MHLLEDVLAGKPAVVGARADRKIRLGGDHVLRARQRGERFAQYLLGASAGIDVRGVEQVDAELESPTHAPNRRILFGLVPECQPAAQ